MQSPLYIVLALVLLVEGCYQAPILYMPPPANLPLLKGSGEGDLSVLADIHGFTARAGWSPVDHLQIFGLASHYDYRPDTSRHAFHSYQEAGAACHGVSTALRPSAVPHTILPTITNCRLRHERALPNL